MKIEVNISKTHFFVLLGIVLLLGGIFMVYAFGGNNPSIMGHSVGEIDWSQPITSDVAINGNLVVSGPVLIQGRQPFTQSTIVSSAWSGPPPDIIAACPVGYQLIGGTCDWIDTDTRWSDARSYPDGNGWHCQSIDGTRTARAHAFCLAP